MKKLVTTLILMLFAIWSFSQDKSISGFVYNKASGQPLPDATVVIKGSQSGTISAANGYFTLKTTGDAEVVLQVQYLGFNTLEIHAVPGAKNLQLEMEPTYIMGNEVVVSASRISEDIRKAPLTIQKITEKQIQSAPSGDYFQSLSNLRDVEVISNSMGFRIFNARGFNTTAPLRVVQFIDGVDNQLPTINIVPGNMFGVSDIDIKNIEVISGPASALYGPNAMQGVISYHTKDPYDYPGLAISVKGGNREYFETQFRVAKTFLKNKLGLKVTGAYMTAKDWRADDPVANLYGHMGTPPQNIYNIIQTKAGEGNALYQDFLEYLADNPGANPGAKQFLMPGYKETDLYDGYINNLKISAGLYYRFLKDFQASYVYRYSTGTASFMGNNRAPLEGFYQQQHVLEFTGKGLTIRAFRASDNTKNTYTLVGTGVNLGFKSLPAVTSAYADAYVNSMATLSGGFANTFDPAWIDQATGDALTAANENWLQPGTPEFEAAYEKIKQDNPPSGSHFSSKTTLYNVEGLYNYSFEKFDLNVGASFRDTKPVSYGTTFADTLQINGEYRQIHVSEYGGFAQGIAHLAKDKVQLFGALRLDKSQNFDLQFSPRLAVLVILGKNNLRLTAQSAFRSPAVTDQYQYLNRGSDIVVGNIDGFGNNYTYSSVLAYQSTGDPGVLKTSYVEAVKPEQLKSIELGYNSTIIKDLYIDLSLYYNRYSDFISYSKVVRPKSGIAGEQSGVDDLNVRNYTVFNVATNTNRDIDTYGGGIGLAYNITSNLRANVNYTYTNIDSAGLSNDYMLAFNTPKHQFNIGLSGSKIYKNFGFSLNFKWVDDYYWESVVGNGPVPSYNTLDLQLGYEIPKWFSTVRLGGSNVFNKKYIQAYAMPRIGGFYYVSWIFSMDFKN